MSDASVEGRAAHWEHVYEAKAEPQLSWHQVEPSVSLELIRQHGIPGAHVMDVGGGWPDGSSRQGTP